MVQMGKTVVPHIKRDTLDRLIALNSERFGTGGNGSRVRSAVVLREPHEYCYTRILASNTRGKRIFAGTNIRFWILAANASIDSPERRIFEYLSEAIRPIYARYGPYVELCTSNLSSLRRSRGICVDDSVIRFVSVKMKYSSSTISTHEVRTDQHLRPHEYEVQKHVLV